MVWARYSRKGYSRTLVPNTMKSMVFGARDLKYWVLAPSGVIIDLRAPAGSVAATQEPQKLGSKASWGSRS